MYNDLRFAIRQLIKNPGFTTVAAVSLALGIAANTTIFSFVNVLLLRPPPIEKPQELWQVFRLRPKASSMMERYGPWSKPGVAYLREHSQSFAGLGAFDPEVAMVTWNRDGVGVSAQLQVVTGNFFDLCGIRAARGRGFVTTEDQMPGTHPVTVVSHAFWQSQLQLDSQVIGRTLIINGVALTIVGVAPASFTGTIAGIAPDLWIPFMMAPSVLHNTDWLTRIDSWSLIGMGRLKPGVRPAQAEAELSLLTRRFDEANKSKELETRAALLPCTMVPAPFRGVVGGFMGMLTVAVILVLLIACANAANLLLARSTARRQEMVVRASLGAARSRLIRQLLTESGLLATLGGVVGLLLAAWMSQLLVRLIPPTLPIRFEATLDWRVLAFTAVVSLVTGMIFGLVPAWRGTGLNLASALNDESRRTVARRSRFASALIVGQMAVCLILLLAGTLCLRSLFKAQSLNLGFEVKDRVAADFNLNDYGYTTAQAQEFYGRLVSRARTLPGVQSAAVTMYLPLGTEHNVANVHVEGQEPPPGQSGFLFQSYSVSPGYFYTMGSRLRQGREFTEGDRAGAPRVAIINEVAATRYWPDQNPVGRRLFVGAARAEDAREIVGVVQTGRYRTLGEDPKPVLFECFHQRSSRRSTLVARVQGNPEQVLGAVCSITQELDPRLALSRATTLEQHLSLALFPVRTSGLLLGVLGLVALVLAVSGLFGLIVYSVSQRTREVGIRLALGAQRRDVLRLVLRQGMKLAVIGVGIGLIGALGATQLLRNLLFGISPTDPFTFLAMPALLLAVAWFACWLPARRASKVDPIVALRYE